MTAVTRALTALVAASALAFASCGGDDSDDGTDGQARQPTLLPDGGEAPPRRIDDLGEAARAANCRLQSHRVDARDHTSAIEERVDYKTNPPTSGRHFQEAAPDGAYEVTPADTPVVHSFEHGRVGIWFRPDLPAQQRAKLRAVAEEDSEQLLILPRKRMPYEIAASAWNRDPEPLGTGRLLTCERLSDPAFDAIRAFSDEHRGQGPEPIP